jgi:hypothetical protein
MEHAFDSTDLVLVEIANASGTMGTTPITNVVVTCSDSAFELEGQVNVSLQDPYTSNTATVLLSDGGNSLVKVPVTLESSGTKGSPTFAFPDLVAQGASYAVSVPTSPPGSPTGLTCTPSNNTGTVGNERFEHCRKLF